MAGPGLNCTVGPMLEVITMHQNITWQRSRSHWSKVKTLGTADVCVEHVTRDT